MKKIVFFLVFSFFLAGIAQAAVLTDYVLKNGYGVRQMGMGNTGVALADDIAAISYNPAGLHQAGIEYSFGNLDSHNTYSAINDYTYLTLGPIGYASLKRRNPSGDSAGTSIYGYGQRGEHGICWGFSYKPIREYISGTMTRSWSSDIGLLFNLHPMVSFGIVGQDLIREWNAPVVGSAKTGLALKFFKERLFLTADLDSRKDGNRTYLGAEAEITPGFRVRVGNNNGSTTAGLGLDFPFSTFDWAVIMNPGYATTHALGFKFFLWKPRKRHFTFYGPPEVGVITVGGPLLGGRNEFSLLQGSALGVDSLLVQLRQAIDDNRIKAIVIRVNQFSGGFGSLGLVQELRAELKRAKDKGKKVVAYIDNMALGDQYYLAAAADKIVAPRGATVGGLGKSFELTRFTELSKKIGVEWEVMTKGKYKGAFNELGSKPTKEQKDMIAGMVRDLYRQMLEDISGDRSIAMEEMKEMGSGEWFGVEQAKKLGLIDEIGYFKDATRLASKLAGRDADPKIVRGEELAQPVQETYLFAPVVPRIAVIEVDGMIGTGKSGDNILFGGRKVGADTISAQFKKARDDFYVRAIILRVNSGGGSAIASAQIDEEVKKAKKKGKIVVASLGDVAASGGYYVAASADKIVANKGTITGSIGVIGVSAVWAELFEKIGVEKEVIKEGKHADMFSGLRKLTPKERKFIEDLMEETYAQFIDVVVEGRGLATDEVKAIAQGRVYTGYQAKDLKLVDEIGGFSKAVEVAKELAGIPYEPELIFYRRGGFMINIGMEQVAEQLGLKQGLLGAESQELLEYRLPGLISP